MSKCKITGKVLSVRIGREETQIALIGSNSEILHSVCVDTPMGAVEDGTIRNFEAVRGMLRSALKTPELKHTRQVVFSLCTSQVISDTITVPDLPASRMEKLLQANVDMYFPVDMHDYQMVWQIVGAKVNDGGQKEQLVQIWAVPKAMLAPYYTVANACGLSVAAVDYCGHSIATAVGASFVRPVRAAKERKKLDWNQPIGAKKKEVEPAAAVAVESAEVPQTDLHITLEKDLVGMTFVQNGQVVLQRFIRCGADPAYQFGEIAMMVEYFHSLEAGRGSTITGFLSGSLAMYQNLADELADTVGIPVNIFAGGYASQMILCVGAAHTTLDFGVTTLNSPSKARKQVSGHLWQYALVLVGGLALAGVILMTLSSRLVWNSEINSLQNTQQTLTIQAAQTNGYADNYNSYVNQYAGYSSDWDTVFASLQTYNDNLVLVLEELETIMPESTSVTGLQIAADGMNVTFACETKEEAAYLIMALRELQYADLAGISNLSGGGRGPATSYGSGESETEKAPTEGSAKQADKSPILEWVSSELSQDELIEVAMSLTQDQIDTLQKVYSQQPATDHETLEELKTDATGLNDEIRKAAIHQMFTTDPFADNTFADLLAEDFKRQDTILWPYIMEDVIRLEREGKLDFGTADNLVSVRNQMEIVVGVLTKDADTIAATERLICTDSSMEQSYIHYLEVELGLRQETPFPYLNKEKLVEHVLSGGFKTGDAELDAKLNGLLSDEAWELLDKLDSPEELGQMLNQYLTEGTTGVTVVDQLIKNFVEAGTTGYEKLDEKIKSFIDSGKLDELLADRLTKYMTEGTTGSQILDGIIKNYLANGTTGNAELDKVIQKYIKGGSIDSMLTEMLMKYLTEGTTGNDAVDDMLEKFLRTGSTGNSAVDEVIKAYLESGKLDKWLEDMLQKYLVDGSTGNKILDELIKKYMETESTGNPVLDKLINAYIDKILGEFDKDKIAELVNKYLTDKTTGNDLYDALLKKYFEDGTTGIKKLDKLIEEYKNGLLGGGSSDDILGWLDKIFGTGSGSTGGGAATGPVDTRIFFTASLAYNDELKNAELERKGLDYNEKIEELEVGA